MTKVLFRVIITFYKGGYQVIERNNFLKVIQDIINIFYNKINNNFLIPFTF